MVKTTPKIIFILTDMSEPRATASDLTKDTSKNVFFRDCSMHCSTFSIHAVVYAVLSCTH